jgi:hypothetical protein
MPRRSKTTAGKVDILELRCARYLDIRAIRGSDFVVTDAILRAPFAQGSAGLRAAADKALAAELEASLEEPKC